MPKQWFLLGKASVVEIGRHAGTTEEPKTTKKVFKSPKTFSHFTNLTFISPNATKQKVKKLEPSTSGSFSFSAPNSVPSFPFSIIHTKKDKNCRSRLKQCLTIQSVGNLNLYNLQQK